MGKLLGQIRAGLIFSGFIAAVLVCLPIQAVLVFIWPHGAKLLPQLFFKFHLWLAGITCVQKGVPYVPLKGEPGCLMVANHVSYFDASALGASTPVSFVAKTEVAGWPVFGIMAKLARTVFINRNIRGNAGKDAVQIQARLYDGDNIVLFPEGTSWDGVKILPFKSALFGAAESEKGKILVQPVSQTYRRIWGLPLDRRTRPFFAWYGDMDFIPHKWAAYVRGPFEVVVRFHSPVSPSSFLSRREMAAWCEDVVRRGVLHDRDGRAGDPELPLIPDLEAAAKEQNMAAE